MKRFSLISFLAFFACLVPSREIAFAEGGIAWGPNGVPICTARNTQQHIRMVPDGSGGAIIVWEDWRRSNEADIYAQRISKNGDGLWGGDFGVVVCTAPNSQVNPVIVSDGSGGAIIAWEDLGSSISAIYALRINGNTGSAYDGWVSTGVLVYASSGEQRSPEIVEDGNGGAVVVWQEFSGRSIMAGKVGPDGSWLWASSVTTGMNRKSNHKVINDGQEGAIVVWEEIVEGNSDIYGQRLSLSDGTIWSSSFPVCADPSQQINPQIVPDGQRGAIITWTDFRNGNGNPDIYAQRIDSNGNPIWPKNGIAVCMKEGEQGNPVIINDLISNTTTGAIIAWEDMREGNWDIYAAKVGTDTYSDSETGGGKLMAGGLLEQRSPRLVSDNQGGGFISWIEKELTTEGWKIFVSRKNGDGASVWTLPQVSICQPSNIVEHQMVAGANPNQEVIIAWVGGTAGDYNIYAQRVFETATILPASISGDVVNLDVQEVIKEKIKTIKGITGVQVEALRENKLASRDTTLNGYYELTGLSAGASYEVRATWSANDIVSSVSLQSKAPNNQLFFALEVDYILGEIVGTVSGVEKKDIAGVSSLKSKRISGSGLQMMLSPANGIPFVELEQRGKVIVRVPLGTDGSYSIPNLLPGKFTARAYNGSIYSNPRIVNLKDGETLRVDFTFAIMPEETVFNHPNPAKDGSTTIRYYCGYNDPESEIKIYNVNGELVREVKDSEIDKARAGEKIYNFLWDCKNSSGKDVASGVYIYIVEVKEKSSGETKKVVKRMAIIR